MKIYIFLTVSRFRRAREIAECEAQLAAALGREISLDAVSRGEDVVFSAEAEEAELADLVRRFMALPARSAMRWERDRDPALWRQDEPEVHSSGASVEERRWRRLPTPEGVEPGWNTSTELTLRFRWA